MKRGKGKGKMKDGEKERKTSFFKGTLENNASENVEKRWIARVQMRKIETSV